MQDEILTVSELTAQIQGMLGTTFDNVLVQGEISQPRTPRSGHVYLTLKDEGAVLPGVIWRSAANRLRYAPEEGLEVISRGSIDVYPPHGRYQLIIRQLEPVGTGALQLAFEQLRARLEAEGLFAPEKKRALPFLPRRIALVTSKTGAAVRDMVTVIQRRHAAVTVLLLPVRVQGEQAAGEIARALAQADARARADVIIVGRGGGSIEDLWAFNEEVVARAIAACRTPVVSAVGHETDITIADLVADVRAATPSQAGELVVPDASTLRQGLAREQARLASALQRRTDRLWQRLEALADRPVLRDPSALVSTRRERLRPAAGRLHAARPAARLTRQRAALGDLAGRLAPPVTRRMALARERLRPGADRLDRAVSRGLADRRRVVSGLAARLMALSPLAVLGRGYSLTTVIGPDGARHVVRSAADVDMGEILTTRLSSGAEVASRVEAIDDGPAATGEGSA